MENNSQNADIMEDSKIMRRYEMGETFEEKGVEIMCVPADLDCKPTTRLPSCFGCVFAGKGIAFCMHIACTKSEREDGMQAHFHRVEDVKQ